MGQQLLVHPPVLAPGSFCPPRAGKPFAQRTTSLKKLFDKLISQNVLWAKGGPAPEGVPVDVATAEVAAQDTEPAGVGRPWRGINAARAAVYYTILYCTTLHFTIINIIYYNMI